MTRLSFLALPMMHMMILASLHLNLHNIDYNLPRPVVPTGVLSFYTLHKPLLRPPDTQRSSLQSLARYST
jgi:hypothetical protein